MQLSLGMALEQRQHLYLGLEGEYLESCLPKAESFLRSNLPILRMLKKRLEGQNYRSIMDAVLVCFLPHFKQPQLDYYAGKGKLLKYSVSQKTLLAVDSHLLNSLTVLKTMYGEFLQKELWGKGKNHNAQAFDAALEASGWGS